MNYTHKSWVSAAAEAGLVRFEDATVTIKTKGADDKEIPFKSAVFLIETAADAQKLFEIADANRDKDAEGNAKETEIGKLLSYAYGLNCRAKIRQQNEPQDPDKAVKKIAEMLVKSGQFKNLDKALAAAKLMRETPDEE